MCLTPQETRTGVDERLSSEEAVHVRSVGDDNDADGDDAYKVTLVVVVVVIGILGGGCGGGGCDWDAWW